MAIETDGERGLSAAQVLDQAQPVERALLAGNGTISIPRSEAELTSVDIADVDLLLSFTDGSFIVITNGALEAISETAHTVAFNDRSTSLDSLFKMVGISNHAKSGSLRVVSGNVDAPKTLEDIEAPQPPENDFFTSNDLRFSDRVAAPAPIVNTGKGPGFLPVPNIAEDLDPVVPVVTPRPSVYRAGQEVPPPPSEPAIALDPDITADDIINGAEATGNIPITGIATGSVKSGDSVNLMINGKTFTGVVLADGTFSINVPGTDLAADSDTTIDASVTIINETGNPVTATDSESYTVNISPPQPTITLDANITADDIINNAEAAGNVTITGSVGGDAKAGDTVTLTLTSTTSTGTFIATYTGLVLADNTFSIDVAGSSLVADSDKVIAASITTYNAFGIAGTGTDTEGYTVNITPPEPPPEPPTPDTTPPEIPTSQLISYAENHALNTVVGAVAASDNIGVTGFQIVGGTGASYYTIDKNGQITLINAAANDFEGASNSFTLEIRVNDAAGNLAVETVTLNVLAAVNEKDTTPPAIPTGQVINYLENQNLGSNTVGVIAASDAYGVTSYEITGGTGLGYFDIDSVNGQITVTNAAANDFELSQIFTLEVRVGDLNGNFSTEEISLKLTNIETSIFSVDTDLTESDVQLLTSGILTLGNDTTPATIVEQAATSGNYGTFSVNATGSWTYATTGAQNQLNDGQVVTENFIVTTTDGGFSTVTIKVTGTNDGPIAQAVSASVNEDGPAITIAANYSDIDSGDSHTFSIDDTGTLGLVTNNGDGTFSYNPNGQFESLGLGETATDTFTYTVDDGHGGTDTKTVTVTIVGQYESTGNHAPVAQAVTATVSEDGPGSTITSVYTDADAGDTHTFSIDNTGTLGSVISNGDGSFTYDPTGRFDSLAVGDTATDTFTYTVTDNQGASSTQTVTVTVTGVNDVPVVLADSKTTDENTILDSSVPVASDVDGTIASYQLAADVGAGNGTLTFNPDGSYSFDPGTDFDSLAVGASRNVSFSYTATDNDSGVSSVQTVTIKVTGTNDGPIANAVTLVAMAEDIGTRLITQAELLSTASDTDGDTLSVSNLTADNGALVNIGDGTWTYTPTLNDDTNVSFSYDISDGTATISGSATLDILPVNDPPTQTAPVVLTAIDEDSGARIITQAQLLAGVSDTENNALTVTNLGITSGSGSLVQTGAGVWTYTPAANDDTQVSFTYTITDNGSTGGFADPRSVAGSATLDITPVNDAPETANIAVIGVEDTHSIAVTISGTDVDGSVASFALSGLPANGALYTDAALTSLAAAGTDYPATGSALTLYFVPAADWNGVTTLSYVAKDDLGLADASPGTATITVTPINDAPTALPVTLAPIVENSGVRIITEAELLTGANDVDGDTLQASNLGISSGSGTLTEFGVGVWHYTPALNDVSEVSFTYLIADNGTTNGIADPKTVVGSATMDITPIIITIPKADITIFDPALNDTDNSSVVTFDFNVIPVGFTESDLTAINGTIQTGSLTKINDYRYEAVFTANDGFEGSGFVAIDASKFTDGVLDNEASISNSVDIDTLNPTVTISDDNIDTDGIVSDNDQVVNYTLTFSEQVAALTSSDINITGGTLTDGPVLAGDGLSATFQVTADDDSKGDLSVTVKDTVVDMHGNKLIPANNTLPLDTENPWVTIDFVKNSLSDTDKSSRVDFIFNEAPVSFTETDISFTNGSISDFQMDDATHYHVTFTANDTFTGTGSVTVSDHNFTDAALNDNLATAFDTVAINTVDNTPPSIVSITMSDYALKIGDTSAITIVFSEAVSDFSKDDVSVPNGSILGDFTGSNGGKTWTANFTPDSGIEAAGNVLTVIAGGYTDLAGNTGPSGTSANYSIDTKSPTVTVDIIDSSLSDADNNSVVNFTFSEVPIGFTASDITTVGGSINVGSLAATANPLVYTATFTANDNITGTNNGSVTVAAGSYSDLAGNLGGTASDTVTIDTINPTVAVNIVAGSLNDGTNSSTVSFTFSEIPTSFTESDIATVGGSINAGSLAVTANPLVYSAIFTAQDSFTGTGSVTVTAGSYTDAALNPGNSGADTVNIDTENPTITNISLSDTALRIGDTSTVTITFSERVTGFDKNDVTAPNFDIVGNFVGSNGDKTWTATFTPKSGVESASNTLTVAATYTDMAGNSGSGGTSGNYSIDTIAPAPTITAVTVSGDDILTIPESNANVTISGTVGGDAKIGDTVTVTVNGKAFTEVLTSSAFSISTPGSDLVADSDKIIDISISSTDAAGNLGTGGSTKAYTLLSSFTGTDGDDTIIGNNADNSLIGGLGNDTLEGRGGADSLIGGGGNDTATYASATTGVFASLTSTYWSSQTGDASGDSFTSIENLSGSSHDDTLIGSNAGANILHGGDGDDILEGMAGADQLFGDSGSNYASYAHAPATGGTVGVIASLAAPAGNTGHAAGDVYNNIQNLIGSSYDDTLTGRNGEDNILIGGTGADTLIGGTDGDKGDAASYVFASAVAGVIGVTASLTTGLADVVIAGEAIGDTYTGIENLIGSTFNDTLIGDAVNNILTGGDGNDTLEGLAGADHFAGGNGTDTVSYAHATTGVVMDLAGGHIQVGDDVNSVHDGITATDGVVTGIDSYDSIENIIGSSFSDTIYGDSQDNVINGGAGNDTINGGAGNDTIDGGTGRDTIDGGLGNDTMTGGAGTDTIYANQGQDSAYGGDGNDTFYVSSLPANLPSFIDGGADDGSGGNIMVLQNLVNGSYTLAGLAGNDDRLVNIDTLNVKGDGAATAINISSTDVQNMVDAGTPASAQLIIKADSGDTLNLSASAVAAGETMSSAVHSDHIDYTILNASSQQVAQIHWQTA